MVCGSVRSRHGADEWNRTPSANWLQTCEASAAITPCEPRSVLPAAADGPQKKRTKEEERGHPFCLPSVSLFWVYQFFNQNGNHLAVFPLTFLLRVCLGPFKGGPDPATCSLLGAALAKPPGSPYMRRIPGGLIASMGHTVSHLRQGLGL